VSFKSYLNQIEIPEVKLKYALSETSVLGLAAELDRNLKLEIPVLALSKASLHSAWKHLAANTTFADVGMLTGIELKASLFIGIMRCDKGRFDA
jgi:hypothetical protein